MSDEKNLREYWLLQHGGDAFIYESLDEFPPDGDKSLLVHVREVIDETWQADASTRKYEFTGETRQHDGVTLRQIRRIRDGDIGGWIESEANLSHEGDCWVSDNALVYGDAKVYGNAMVSDNAKVYGNAKIYKYARVVDYATVIDDAIVFADAIVCGDAIVSDKAKVYGDARVYSNAKVCGNCEVCGDAQIYGGVIG